MKAGTFRILVFVTALIVAVAAYPSVGALDLDTQYYKHNVSFMYPKGVSFEIEAADNEAGVLLGRLQFHILYVSWTTSTTVDPKQIDQWLKDAVDFVAGKVGLGKINMGYLGESKVQKHSVTYRSFTGSFEGKEIGGAVGSWYCNETSRLFALLSFSITDSSELFNKYLANFNCHRQECQLRIDDLCILNRRVWG